MPINNISQQLNAIFAAVAGAERIFSLLDERPEIDDGGVELVEAPADDPAMSEAEEKADAELPFSAKNSGICFCYTIHWCCS